MRNRASNSVVGESLRLFGRRLSAFFSDGRRLLTAAALLHATLAVALFCAGRAQVAPSLIDRDGIVGSFALDSNHYQRDAARLAEVFRQDGVAAWAGADEPVHAKLISLLFALLGPLFGQSTLSAEPFNLLCYLAVVWLTLALGREVGGARAGTLAACVAALWPTFLLHTLQLLKDALFVAAALALVLCVTTWLTRDYGPRGAVTTGALTAAAVLLLLLIRPNFAVVVFALVVFGLVLLVVRQLIERRALYWNTACPLLILAAGAVLLLSSNATRDLQKLKHYPSDQGGQPKAVAGVGERVPTVVSYLPRRRQGEEPPGVSRGRLDVADRAALKIGGARYRFAALYAESGSNIDSGVRFRRPGDILRYLPRAFVIGWWAPFPNTWAAAGMSVGVAGKLLAGAETLVMYAFGLLALSAVLRPPRRLAAWLLLSTSAFGVTLLALVVPNVGALYRFRYTFWLLLIVLAAKGFESARASFGKVSSGRRGSINRAAGASLVCLLAVACACSSRVSTSDDGAADAASRAQAAASHAGVTAAPADDLSFDLVNFTGSKLRDVYVSPSDSKGWEENILGGDRLDDGDAVQIRFSPEERAVLWDVRIESRDEHYAEWKGLDLRGVSRITMLLGAVGEPTAVAEVE